MLPFIKLVISSSLTQRLHNDPAFATFRNVQREGANPPRPTFEAMQDVERRASIIGNLGQARPITPKPNLIGKIPGLST
jgi:hypothetical protein